MNPLWSLAWFPTLALAGPTTLSHSGRALNSAGDPLTGSFEAVFQVYATDTPDAVAIWDETDTVVLNDGYFSTVLGDSSLFPAGLFERPSLWLGVSIAGSELSPRQALRAVPTAMFAQNARAVDGLSRSELEADLASADRLTSGTVMVGLLPTGTTAGTVALGDHTHDPELYRHNSRVFVHRFQVEDGADYSTSWTTLAYGNFDYAKRSATSQLKITWTASMRTIGPASNGSVCMRKYLVNDVDCGPAPLGLFQHDTGSAPSSDKHFPHSTTVVCEGLPAGNLRFTQQTRRRDGDEDCYFGYSGSIHGGPFFTTLVIEEVEY